MARAGGLGGRLGRSAGRREAGVAWDEGKPSPALTGPGCRRSRRFPGGAAGGVIEVCGASVGGCDRTSSASFGEFIHFNPGARLIGRW